MFSQKKKQNKQKVNEEKRKASTQAQYFHARAFFLVKLFVEPLLY